MSSLNNGFIDLTLHVIHSDYYWKWTQDTHGIMAWNPWSIFTASRMMRSLQPPIIHASLIPLLLADQWSDIPSVLEINTEFSNLISNSWGQILKRCNHEHVSLWMLKRVNSIYIVVLASSWDQIWVYGFIMVLL